MPMEEREISLTLETPHPATVKAANSTRQICRKTFIRTKVVIFSDILQFLCQACYLQMSVADVQSTTVTVV